MESFDFAVVGGGIVGAATLYKLQQKFPEARLVLLEKEPESALHQTGRNSGVIHSGLYYKPGSLKATTCRDGYLQLLDFCREHNVAHEICGKVVVATTDSEADRLKGLADRGKTNGLDGLEFLTPTGIREHEPHIAGVAGLRVPHTGIVDYRGMTRALVQSATAIQPKTKVLFGFKVTGTAQGSYGVQIIGEGGTTPVWAQRIVFCGGLQSDRLARLDGAQTDVRIVPFRGDYYELSEAARHKVRHLVYPVPDPNFPFLGVHFTRMHDGSVECGPNAVFAFEREGYSKTSFNWQDTADSLGFAGTWKLFAQHWRYGLGEYHRAFSRSAFLKALQALMPGLEDRDLVPGRSGVRAQALQPNGSLVDDFVVVQGASGVHLVNAPSPAATASLAIADHLVAELLKTQ
jgi:L-2-hydroxyglutarate oxidase